MKELFNIDMVEANVVKATLKGYEKVNAQIRLTATMVTVTIDNDEQQLLEQTEPLNVSINELCLIPSINKEYLSVEISGADMVVQIKNQQDEKGIIIDLFDSKGEFLGGLGYLTEEDILENEKEIV